jgi:dTDP-4-dehydrorhamnose 3,5-epimerase-like enzyme
MNIDHRGSFTEFLKTIDRGQVSINISKPGIVKGNHWHHTKNEKFLVVSGKGIIRFRKIDENEVIEYFVSGDRLNVIDIPPGYTHNIENLGKSEGKDIFEKSGGDIDKATSLARTQANRITDEWKAINRAMCAKQTPYLNNKDYEIFEAIFEEFFNRAYQLGTVSKQEYREYKLERLGI